jgi:hypothetical protein
MNQIHSSSAVGISDETAMADRRSPAWGAIIAGAVAGLATHILLMMLLTAIGLGAADPATSENPVATFGTGTAIAWTISALIALFVGGWVAGRCAARVHSVSGAVHGFLVWCVATIASLLLVASGAGALVGGTARVLGEGLSALGKPLAGAADLAKEAVGEASGAINSMIDEVAENPQVKSAAGGVAAARREIGQALRQLFREGGNLREPGARNATVQALTRAGLSEADATRMVDRWIASMEELRTQLDRAKQAAAVKARELADKAAEATAKGALWGFIGFVFGAVAASFGGRRGQSWEYHHTEIGDDSSLDPEGRRPQSRTHIPTHA